GGDHRRTATSVLDAFAGSQQTAQLAKRDDGRGAVRRRLGGVGRADHSTHPQRAWPFVVLAKAIAYKQGRVCARADGFERSAVCLRRGLAASDLTRDRKSTRLNSSHQ